MRILATIITTLLCLTAGAQQTYTQRLQDNHGRRGRIVLHHLDESITSLVNGVRPAENTTVTNPVMSEVETEISEINTTRRNGARVKMSGFRIQIYAGGSSRQSKQQAERAEQKAHELMPDEMIYTTYTSPRWVCRVGDYRSYEEAYDAMRQLQVAGGFPDAVIVKSKVQVLID